MQGDVAAIFEKIGDAQVSIIKDGQNEVGKRKLDDAETSYEEALKIRQALAAQAPADLERASNVATVFEKIGDVRTSLGNYPAADAAYRQGLSVRREVAAAEPQNARGLVALSGILARIGDVNINMGELDAARVAYEESLVLRRRLVAADPNNSTLLTDLVGVLQKIGDLRERMGLMREAQQAFEEARNIRASIDAGMNAQRDSCRQEAGLRSRVGDPITITFRNTYGADLRVFWLDYEGKRKFYSTIRIGSSSVQSTFLTHPWVFTDASDTCVAIYVPKAGTSEFVIR